MKKFILLFILMPSISLATSMSMIVEQRKLSEVNRVVEVKMYDNFYEPNEIKIKKGETIKFKVYNFGELVHEFNIATKKMHLKHQPEMTKLVENEILLADKIDKKKMKEMEKKDQSMSHSHANSVLLEPNEDGEIIWKFNTEAKLEAACNIPGHYETGMIAKIKY